MTYFLHLLVSGMAIGALYGLVAMGFAMIFKVSRVVNFAQGEVMMLIAYIAYSVALQTDGNSFAIVAAIVVSAGVIGALIERMMIRPMIGQPVFSIVMMTIALAVAIRSVVGLIWGSNPYAFHGEGRGELWTVLGVNLLPSQVLLLVLYAAICIGIWAFLRFSLVGIAMRATASDQTVALLMGVSIANLYRVAWIISALIAGVGGVLFANIYHIGPDISHVGIRAFPAAILGGLDSVVGSGFGGIIIGIVENMAGGYIGSGFKEIAGFVVIIAILMIRPYGLFGQREIERV